MNLKQTLSEWVLASLNGDFDDWLIEGLDRERRIDCRNHGREAAYAAAFGVFTDFPGNPVFGREALWEKVLQMLDIICAIQFEDGMWDWHVPATRKTHRSGHVWSVDSWLRLLAEFGPRMDPARRDRLEAMLRRALPGRARGAEQFMETGIHPASKNIFAHSTLQLWLGARLFGERAWEELAAAALDRVVALQFEDGYWPDAYVHRGPTSLYNTVTLDVVSSYARLSGSTAARATVRRAADYHLRMAYPDGTFVETMDERNRYMQPHSGLLERLVWALAAFEETRPAAAWFAERIQERNGAAQPAALGAMRIETWKSVPDGDVPAAARAQGRFVLPTIPAGCLAQPPWFVCVSGAPTQVPARSFHHDLQCHVSAWHRSLGLVLGGGNSLLDPKFSTFRFHGRYLADAGRVEPSARGLALALEYGTIRAFLEVSATENGALQVEARAEGELPPESEVALHLYGCLGRRLTGGGNDLALDDMAFWRDCEPGATLEIGPVRVRSAARLNLMWPCVPVNIYDPPALLPLDQAVLRLSARLCDGPVLIELSAPGPLLGEGKVSA
ncbi:MAG: hypothetical protein K9N49_08525 [Candidatus Marinimicrobia bacterium]|nr:hypothetical protein [Candidatus Neomarinimicrobiota bacterium]